MGVPVTHDVTQTNAGSTAWLPLNRYASAMHRLTCTITGSPTYTIEGTQVNVTRGDTPAGAEIIAVENFSALTAAKSAHQDLAFRAVRVTISSGTGTVRLQLQGEGDC